LQFYAMLHMHHCNTLSAKINYSKCSTCTTWGVQQAVMLSAIGHI